MSEFLTPEEMAALHEVVPKTIYRVLRADQTKPEDERKLPGAYKIGEGKRGIWQIPRAVAETWERSPRGRK